MNTGMLSSTEKPVVECSRDNRPLSVSKGETTSDSAVVSIRPSVYSTTVISYPLTIGGVEYKTTCVSMGNPHAVVFIDKKPADFPVCEVGPLFENNAFFPERTNTEFAYIEDRTTIWMRVWERGTGETLACGTGTCATVVAAILNGLVDTGEKITVHLLGGDLVIEWSGNEEDSVFMTGPAETVFNGDVEI